jgi:hypothetical protein
MAVCMATSTIDRYTDVPHAHRWVLIFEKAWAKLHGSYEATAGGLTCDTLNYLCGGLTRHISTRPTAATAGLDEGLLSLFLSNLLHMENPYSYNTCQ